MVVFKSKVNQGFFDPEIIIKFIISILIMNLLRQLIFMVVYEFKAVKNYVESDTDTRENLLIP